MSEFKFVKPGLNAVGQYQLSGIPFLSSSIKVNAATGSTAAMDPTVITFPTVTKFITVRNEDNSIPLRLAFSENAVKGVTAHYFDIAAGEQFTADWRVAKLYLIGTTAQSTASIAAGLSMIGTENLPNNWSGSDDSSIYNPGIG